MKAHLAERLPNQWKLTGFSIDEWEILDRTPWKWRYHFTATARPKEDLYKSLGTLNHAEVLEVAERAGASTPWSGTAVATSDGGTWHSVFDLGPAAERFEAAPKSAYGTKAAIIGDAGFQEFLASAQVALQQHATELATDEDALSEEFSQWNVSNQTFTQIVQQINTDSDAETAQLQHKRLNADRHIADEVRNAQQALQATLRDELSAQRQAHEQATTALMQAHRASMQALHAQNRQASDQRLSREQQIEKRRELREMELDQHNLLRAQMDQARTLYADRTQQAQRKHAEQRANLQHEIAQQVTSEIEASSAALQEKRAQQMQDITASNQELLDRRARFEQRYVDMQARKEALERQHQLIQTVEARLR